MNIKSKKKLQFFKSDYTEKYCSFNDYPRNLIKTAAGENITLRGVLTAGEKDYRIDRI